MKKLLLAVLSIAGTYDPTIGVADQVVTNVTKLVLPNPPVPTRGEAVVVTVQFPNKPGERIIGVTLLITTVKGEREEQPKGRKVAPPVPPINPSKGGKSAIAEGPKWDLRASPMDTEGPFKTESPGLALVVRHKF